MVVLKCYNLIYVVGGLLLIVLILFAVVLNRRRRKGQVRTEEKQESKTEVSLSVSKVL